MVLTGYNGGVEWGVSEVAQWIAFGSCVASNLRFRILHYGLCFGETGQDWGKPVCCCITALAGVSTARGLEVFVPAVTNEIVAILQALLPGFFAAWVFYGLTAHQKASPFERIVQALIYTMIVQVITSALREVFLFFGSRFAMGTWTQDVRLFWAFVVGGVIGVVFAGFANSDTLHHFLRERDWMFRKPKQENQNRRWRWTRGTSYPSEWYGALSENPAYVVLHLSGNRRLYGWPEEWPDQPDQGHFVIAEAEWLDEDNKSVPLKTVWSILVPASDVELVEIMYPGDSQARKPPGGNNE